MLREVLNGASRVLWGKISGFGSLLRVSLIFNKADVKVQSQRKAHSIWILLNRSGFMHPFIKSKSLLVCAHTKNLGNSIPAGFFLKHVIHVKNINFLF